MNITKLLHKRADDTYVAEVNGLPYHVTSDHLELYPQAQALEAALTEPLPPEPGLVVTEPVVTTISRRQCARELLVRQLITGAEAVAMTQTGAPPAVVQGLFDKLTEPAKTLAIIDFAADTYVRTNQLLVGAMTTIITTQTPGATEAQIAAAIDEFFRAASAH